MSEVQGTHSGLSTQSELQRLHALLIETVFELSRARQKALTAEAMYAISNEIYEVNHRATMVGQLVFSQHTRDIGEAIGKVKESKAKLDEAIAQIDRLNNFLKTIGAFLGLVDKVIDLVKLV